MREYSGGDLLDPLLCFNTFYILFKKEKETKDKLPKAHQPITSGQPYHP